MSDHPSQSQRIIQCRHLGKVFVEGGGKVSVLDDVNFDIDQGECIAIMGRSGAGKSTLLHLLGGLDVPSHGEVYLKGQNLNQMNDYQRGLLRNRSLGFVYQFHHLLPEFTALENVAMPLLLRREARQSIYAQAEKMLQRVGLQHRLHHRPGKLSGGERQRVAIARALVTRPDCVLADEPTGNLDRDNALNIMDLMSELNREMQVSFVIVTHEQSMAERMDKVLVLEEGCLALT
jgi:lipoprotein-releasing system ATP-binding protein